MGRKGREVCYWFRKGRGTCTIALCSDKRGGRVGRKVRGVSGVCVVYVYSLVFRHTVRKGREVCYGCVSGR